MIQATTRTCRPNDARQLSALVTSPPISGPAAAPRPPAPLTTPKYLARDFTSGKVTVTRMYMGGIISAEPTPSSME